MAITAPSLDATKNVSGISSVVRVILGVKGFDFVHFQVGSQDSEKKDARWFLAQLGMYARLPGFLRSNKVSLLHLNTALNPMSIWRDLLLAAISRLLGVKVLVHLHGGKYLADECHSAVTRIAIRALLGCGNGVAVLSKAEVDIVRSRGYTQSRDIAVLTNSIDLSEIPALGPKPPSDVLRLIFLGRFHESKGLDEIKNAVVLLKQKSVPFTLTVFGSGPEEASFCDFLQQELGDSFAFGGVVSGRSKWDALNTADVFLLPSRHGEGLPMAMLEAMAVGLCVVVTDLASITSVVQDGNNGVIVPKQNAAALAGALESLVSDSKHRERLASKAKHTVLKNYSADEYRDRVADLYRQIA